MEKEKTKRKNKKKELGFYQKLTNFFSSTAFLTFVFVLLVIIVAFLIVLVHQKRKEVGDELHANIVIPIYKKDADFEFSISAVDLKKSKEYVFKVVNYMKDIVNQEDVSYKITIKNPTDSVISLTKNDDNNNLMKLQKETVLDNEILMSKEQDEVFYFVHFKKVGKLKNDDLITVHIAS